MDGAGYVRGEVLLATPRLVLQVESAVDDHPFAFGGASAAEVGAELIGRDESGMAHLRSFTRWRCGCKLTSVEGTSESARRRISGSP
jgi:hypothetical protein